MPDLNGMIHQPTKGLSEVENPGDGRWSMVVDSENSNALTLILGGVSSYTAVVLTGPGETIITPTVLAADTHNYAPTGWSGANRVRLAASLAVDITGFSATATVLQKNIFNSTSSIITLKHEDGLSTAANRIHIPGATDLPLYQDDSVAMWYDTVLARWRLV